MTYATLMVHLELGRPNVELLQIVGGLADRFHAAVIGIAACQPIQMAYGDSYTSGDVVQQDRDEIERQLKETEAEFRSALQSRVETLQWRAAVTFTSLFDIVAREARSADLIITGAGSSALVDVSRRTPAGDLVMQVGRPVLIVPAGADSLKLDHVVVGWKETRETRRAAYDALPLLKVAGQVTVVEIAAEKEISHAQARVDDVVGWLKRHGVAAHALASPSTGDDTKQLYAIAQEKAADVIVAGAYGHSRFREWVLGGVTRDLLLYADRCSLVSH